MDFLFSYQAFLPCNLSKQNIIYLFKYNLSSFFPKGLLEWLFHFFFIFHKERKRIEDLDVLCSTLILKLLQSG
jgi:hypothetical protein